MAGGKRTVLAQRATETEPLSAGIQRRLKKFSKRYGTRIKFAKRFGIPVESTLRTWTKEKDPVIPGPDYLARFAREGYLNLNWLFLDEGPELRQPEVSSPDETALAAIAAELRASEQATENGHRLTWDRLRSRRDEAWRLAVEGVRPLYNTILQELADHRAQLFAEAARRFEPYTHDEQPPGTAEGLPDAPKHHDRAKGSRSRTSRKR